MNKLIFYGVLNLIFLIALTQGFGAGGKKTWNFEIKSVTSKSSDPSLFNVDLKVDRITRGEFALSGDLVMNYDIVDGDDNLVEAKSFRSPSGNGEYTSLPFKVSPTHFNKVINTYYKDVLMATLKECSDMPYFEDQFEPPFEKKTYKLEKCQFSRDGLPNHLQDGFYKLIISGKGACDWEFELIAEVTPDV